MPKRAKAGGRPRLGFNRHTAKDGVVFIGLSQGQVAVIDAADLPLVTRYRWHAGRNPATGAFHAVASVYEPPSRIKGVLMHRLLIGAEGRQTRVEHVNGNRLDNRRENLKLATKSRRRRKAA